MTRDYKHETELRTKKNIRLYVWIPRELGDKLKAKLAQENKRITDFVKEAIVDFLKNS